MGKPIKIALFSLVSLIAILIISVALLITFVNPNDYKTQVTDYVSSKLGRNIAINGDLTWTLYPWLGVKADNILIANPSEFQKVPFVKIGHVEASVRLLPLLSGNLEVGNVTLNKVDANFTRLASGQSNWDFTPTTAKQKKTAASDNLDLSISSIQVNDANIHYLDQLNHQDISLSELSLETKNVELGSSFPINLDFQLIKPDSKLKTHISMEANVLLDTNNKQYHFTDLSLTSDLNKGKTKIAINGNIDLDLNKNTITSKNFTMRLDDLKLAGNLNGQNMDTNPVINGNIDVDTFNLKSALTKIGHAMPTQKTSALEKAAASFAFTASKSNLAIKDFTAKVDDIKIKGDLKLPSFSPLQINFNLALDQLNLDDYLPPPSAPSGGGENAFASVRNMKIAGNVKLGRFIIGGVTSSSINATINANNGVIKLSPMTATVYQGTSYSNITIDARGNKPRYTVDEKINNLQLAALTKGKVSGTADVSLQISMLGNNSDQLLNSMNGHMSLSSSSGALEGVDFFYQVTNAVTKANKSPKSGSENAQTKSSGQTKFSGLKGTATITNGVIKTEDLALHSSTLNANAKGTANLVNKTLNMLVNVKTLIPISLVDGKIKLSEQIFEVPFMVGGTFSNPSYTPDFGVLAAELIKSQATGLIKDIVNSPRDITKDIRNILPF